jgi:hypothetical protein
LKRVYIAGPYSADNVLDVFENMRRGMVLATQVRQLGFAPFCPWMDFMYFFLNNKIPFTIDNCYEYSMKWLEVSDAVLLVPGWRDSKGSMAEVDNAWELGIPVFEHLLALMDWDTDPNSLSDGIKPSHNGVK